MRRLYAFASMAALAAAIPFAPENETGGAATSPPSPPAADPKVDAKAEPKAAKAAKSEHVVWCSPGYEQFSIGRVYKGPGDMALGLQAAGKARIASPAEVKAAGDNIGTFG